MCSDPNRHEVGVRLGVGWLWEGLDCKPPVVGNVGHFQFCWFCCPTERLMGSKGYWGTSIFSNFSFDIYSGFFGLFWAEMVGFVGLFWALLRWYAIGVMLLRPLVWLKLGQSSSEECFRGLFWVGQLCVVRVLPTLSIFRNGSYNGFFQYGLSSVMMVC